MSTGKKKMDTESPIGTRIYDSSTLYDTSTSYESTTYSDPASPPADTKKDSKPYGLWIGLIVAVGLAAFFAGTYVMNYNSDVITSQELVDSLAAMEDRIMNQPQPTMPSQQGGNMVPSAPVVISIDNDPIIGDPAAPITIIEFSDFQCPFCARFHAQTLPLLIEEYIDKGQVKLVYRDFPLQDIHPNAVPAAVAAECANEQGEFKSMHDMLFDNQAQWSNAPIDTAIALFGEYATAINIDRETFDSCLITGKFIEDIRDDLIDGRNYGIDGTPGFLIGNDEVGYISVSGAQPFEVFQQIIESQLGT